MSVHIVRSVALLGAAGPAEDCAGTGFGCCCAVFKGVLRGDWDG